MNLLNNVMLKYHTIYMLTSPTNEVYIGQTCDLNSRLCAYNRGHCKGQPKLFKSIQLFGFNHFKVTILEDRPMTETLVDRYEVYYIRKYNSVKAGLNTRHGGKTCGVRELNFNWGGDIPEIYEGKIVIPYRPFNKKFSDMTQYEKYCSKCKERVNRGKLVLTDRQVNEKKKFIENKRKDRAQEMRIPGRTRGRSAKYKESHYNGILVVPYAFFRVDNEYRRRCNALRSHYRYNNIQPSVEELQVMDLLRKRKLKV